MSKNLPRFKEKMCFKEINEFNLAHWKKMFLFVLNANLITTLICIDQAMSVEEATKALESD